MTVILLHFWPLQSTHHQWTSQPIVCLFFFGKSWKPFGVPQSHQTSFFRPTTPPPTLNIRQKAFHTTGIAALRKTENTPSTKQRAYRALHFLHPAFTTARRFCSRSRPLSCVLAVCCRLLHSTPLHSAFSTQLLSCAAAAFAAEGGGS